MDINKTERRRAVTTAFAALALILLTAVAPTTAAPRSAIGASSPVAAADVRADDDRPEIGDYFNPNEGAAPAYTCLRTWCWESTRLRSSNDPGGYKAEALLWNRMNQSERYVARFVPLGEVLHLMDRYSDGHRARVDVLVTDRNHYVEDEDTFYTSYDATFNLGTPDGSGDVPEGWNVWIRVCQGDGKCSQWAHGTA